jgi:hypothetical protein
MMWICFLFFLYFIYFVASGQLSALFNGSLFTKGVSKSSDFDKYGEPSLSVSPSPGVPSRNAINKYFDGVYKDGEIVVDYWCHRKLYVNIMATNGVMLNDSLPYNLIPKEICPSFGFLLSKNGVSL